MDNNKKIWITWEIQRRNKSLSKELGIELYEIIVNKPRIVRYFFSIIKTFRIIYENQPSIVFVQNPSLILALFSLFFRFVFDFKLVVDEHNAGLYPLEGKNVILMRIARYIAVKADYVIVTNSRLADIVKIWGGRALVLPDPLPNFGEIKLPSRLDNDSFNVLFVCTWSADEPVTELIESAKNVNDNIKIFITGNHGNIVKNDDLPDNIELTGFLDEHEYISLLKQVDAVIVLTLRDNCLNCGAYEAVAAEKPLILSNKKALREYFNKGAIFTMNEPVEIAKNINYLYTNRVEIGAEIHSLKKDITAKWWKIKNNVETILYT